METINDILDAIYFGVVTPLILFVRNLLNRVFLDTLSFLHVPPAIQVMLIACLTALLAFALRRWLKVDEKVQRFRQAFAARHQERDNIALVKDWKHRDLMYNSVDQGLDEDFNTYLAQHYFRYVLIYLLPLFLILAWLNGSLDEQVLPTAGGQPYLLLLPSHPLGMQGISVTLLFLLTYIFCLVIGFWLRKRRTH